MWLAKDNDNRFVKILSGQDTGQINTDATVCNCTASGQPITWGGPFIMLQGNTGTFGFKNLSIREIEGFGATLPPVDPGPPLPPPTGGGGGGGTGSGGGSGGSTGGGGGVPVDLTPVLATSKTSYVEYGGGPQFNPLEFHFIFAGAAWNQAPGTGGGGTGTPNPTPTTYLTDLVLAPPRGDFIQQPDSSQGTYTVYDKATVHFIFWGSQWNTQTSPNWSKTQLMTAIQKIFQSSYFEGLIQYGINKPKIGSIAINTTYATKTNFDDSDLVNIIVDSVNHNQVPDVNNTINGPNTQYVYYIIGAKGKTASTTLTNNYLNNETFHDIVLYSGDNSVYTFAYTDDLNAQAQGNLAAMTQIMSREIVNTLTNPVHFHGDEIGAVTYDANNAINEPEEIGDLCDVASSVIDGVTVNKYYSEEDYTGPAIDTGCIAPSAKPSWISCPTGYNYDPVTQTCLKVNATTVPGGTTVQVADPIFDAPKPQSLETRAVMFTNPCKCTYLVGVYLEQRD